MYRRSVDGDGFIVSHTTHPPPHLARIHRSCGALVFGYHSAPRVSRGATAELQQLYSLIIQLLLYLWAAGNHRKARARRSAPRDK
jgi:hypothetical protein